MTIRIIGERKLVEAFELIGIPGIVAERDLDLVALVQEGARLGAELVLLQSELMRRLPAAALQDPVGVLGCLVLEVPGVGHPAPEACDLRHDLDRVIGAAP